jgi:hypothetical protein
VHAVFLVAYLPHWLIEFGYLVMNFVLGVVLILFMSALAFISAWWVTVVVLFLSVPVVLALTGKRELAHSMEVEDVLLAVGLVAGVAAALWEAVRMVLGIG